MLPRSVLLAAALVLTPALATAADKLIVPEGQIVVNVRTGPPPGPNDIIRPEANQPVLRASVSIKPVGGGEAVRATTNEHGQVVADIEPGLYRVTVEVPGGKIGIEYVRINQTGPGQSVPFDQRALPDRSYAEDPDAPARLVKQIRAAAEACDREEYDRLVRELELLESMDRINATGLEDSARVFDKEVKAQAAKEFAIVRKRQAAAEAALSRLPYFPSRCSLKTAEGGACPDGGGLLAGAINDLFGTDLAGVCQGKQIHGQDNKGGQGRAHESEDHDD